MEQYVQLKAKEVSRKPITLSPGQTLYDARNTMLRYNISRVVIAQGSKPIGIITEKDIARILRADVSKRIDEVKLADVMTKDPITVEENSGLSLCAKMMDDRRISSILTIDTNNNLTGIITKTDLANVYAKHYVGRHSVSEFMTKQVFTVMPNNSIMAAISILVSKGVSRIVVVQDKKPIGIITSRDLLPYKGLFDPSRANIEKSSPEERTPISSGILKALLVKDIMSHEPITVTQDSDLALAALIMINNRISGLPIIDNNGDLVGIVTKTDVVRAFVV